MKMKHNTHLKENYDGQVHCPKCGYPQLCPCKYCHVYDSKTLKWEWVDGNTIACGRCHFSKPVDWWLVLEGAISL